MPDADTIIPLRKHLGRRARIGLSIRIDWAWRTNSNLESLKPCTSLAIGLTIPKLAHRAQLLICVFSWSAHSFSNAVTGNSKSVILPMKLNSTRARLRAVLD